MSKKVLTGVLAALMATGTVAPVFAGTNVEKLHTTAFEATQKALKEGTQLSINEAREAIQAFKEAIGEHADIPTWSSMVDKVQHPIYVEVVDGLLALQKEGAVVTQEAVNKLYTLIYNEEGTADDISDEYKKGEKYGWSGQTDAFQNVLTFAALEAVEAAKTADEIADAKKLVESLKTSKNKDAVAAAERMEAKLIEKEEALNKYDLKVTDFEVTRTGVKVTFEALAETLKDATIEVIDNNGDIVEVQAISKILEGRTTASFSFEKVLSSREIKGVWTVNGLSKDLTEAKLMKDLAGAKTEDDTEKALIELQKAGYIESLKMAKNPTVEKIEEAAKTAYHKALKADDAEIVTAEDVQAIIDEVNTELDTTADEKERVERVKASVNNKRQFLNALSEEGIERVNSEWFEAYAFAVDKESVKTIKDIKTAIDDTNLTKVEHEINVQNLENSLDVEKVEKAIGLVNEFVNPETTKKENVSGVEVEYNVQDRMLEKLNKQLALINVVTSDNTKALKNSLVKLSNLTEEFNYDKVVNEDNLLRIVEELSTGVGTPTNVENLVKFIKGVNQTVITEALKGVEKAYASAEAEVKDGKYTESAKTTIMKAFKALETATVKEENTKDTTNKFVSSIIVEDNLQMYKSYNGDLVTTDVNALVNHIKAANEYVKNNAVNIALNEIDELATESKVDAKKLYNALANEKVGLKGLVVANTDDYAIDAQLLKRNGATDDEVYVKSLNQAIASVNAKVQVANAKSLSEMLTGVNNFAVSENMDILNKSNEERKDISEEVLASEASMKTVAEVKNAIEAATVTKNQKIEAINEAVKSGNRATIISRVNEIVNGFESREDRFEKVEDLITASKKDGNFVGFTTYSQIRNVIK